MEKEAGFYKIHISQKYLLFIIPFFCYYVCRYFECTNLILNNNAVQVIALIKNISYVFALGVCAVEVIKRKKYNLLQLLLAGSLFLFFTFMAFVKNRNEIFITLVFSVIFCDKYFDDFLKFIFRSSCFLYLLVIILSFIGILKNTVAGFEKFGLSTTRQSLGFIYPGQLIMMLIPIVFMAYYLNRNKINKKFNFFWLTASTLIFIFSKTIMGYGLIISFIILINLVNKRRNKIINIISESVFFKNIPYIFFGFTMFMLFLKSINFPFIDVINDISNNRLGLGLIFARGYGIKILGTDFFNNTKYFYQVLDSEYMYMIVACGIIYTAVALWFMKRITIYFINKQDVFLYTIWFMILFNAIMNNGIFNLGMNPFIIVTVPAIRKYKKNNNNRLESVLYGK